MVISDRTKSQLFANDQYLIRIAQGSLATGRVAIHKKPNRNGTPWSAEEHERFLLALERFPSGPWKIIASYVMTRTTRQTMTHAQKYREKITRMKRTMEESASMQPLGLHRPMPKQPHFVLPCNSTSGVECVAPKTEEFEVVENGDFLLSCSEIDEMFNATLLTLFDADEPNVAVIESAWSHAALGDEALSFGFGSERRFESASC